MKKSEFLKFKRSVITILKEGKIPSREKRKFVESLRQIVLMKEADYSDKQNKLDKVYIAIENTFGKLIKQLGLSQGEAVLYDFTMPDMSDDFAFNLYQYAGDKREVLAHEKALAQFKKLITKIPGVDLTITDKWDINAPEDDYPLNQYLEIEIEAGNG